MNRSISLPVKLLRRHPRTWIAVAFGVAVFMWLPAGWSFTTRLLVGWNAGALFFLAAIYLWMGNWSADQICSRYLEEDPSGPIIVIVVIAAALLSLIADVQVLATLRQVAHATRAWHFTLVAVTLLEAWLLVPTMFAMHYTDMFYSAEPRDRPLAFPQTPMPLFWDFAYFSFTIAAASQTADVSTTNLSVRKVVIAHEVISFLFNASILGFAINVTAGLIGG
jgi:uncharacterized membrane protein